MSEQSYTDFLLHNACLCWDQFSHFTVELIYTEAKSQDVVVGFSATRLVAHFFLNVYIYFRTDAQTALDFYNSVSIKGHVLKKCAISNSVSRQILEISPFLMSQGSRTFE